MKDILNFFTQNIWISFIVATIIIVLNIQYQDIKPKISTIQLIEISDKINIEVNKLNDNLSDENRKEVYKNIESHIKELNLDNFALFITNYLIPTIMTLFGLLLYYMAYQLFIYRQDIREVKTSINKTTKSIEQSHILNPDKDNNLSARAQVLDFFDKDLYTDEKIEFNKTIDILFTTDYYSYLLTKSYLDYFFYRTECSNEAIRYIIVDKYCHGLLVYTTLCKYAKYRTRLIKKKDYLNLVTGCKNKELLIGNPFFIFSENNKLVKTKYMSHENNPKELKNTRENEIIHDILKLLKSKAFEIDNVNSAVLKSFINQ